MLKLLKPASPEDLFIQRYDLLMKWALSLTSNNRAQAEDLVHDAFIQFTLRRSELGTIQNADAYLHRVLRNMYLSQVRRATLTEDSRFSIANFDSAEMGLRAIDPRDQDNVQDELRQICQYSCARKETSKAGSVLILRFFHSYYPSETAQILHTTRTAVDWWIQQSRREAKVYVADPSKLKFTEGFNARFATENPRADVGQFGYARTTADLLGELRQAIFASRTGNCLSFDQFKEFYRATTRATVDSAVLSHFVSCPLCLDEVNRLLGLPLLAERMSGDRLGRDRDVPPDSSGGGDGGNVDGGGSVVESNRRYQRQLRETIEHRPQELRIAVNGFVLGAQQVSSEFNKQVLSVNVDEPIGFIEVFSEQNVRLLFFDVDQPIDGNIEQRARADFERGRTLELSLSFRGPWPTLNVSYHDPTFEAIESYVEGLDPEVQSPTSNVQRLTEEVQGAKSNVQSLADKEPGRWTRVRERRSDFGHWTLDFRLFLRPGAVTAIFAVILVAAVVVFYRHIPTSPISTVDLLQKAAASEEVVASNRDQVLHRTVQLEEKSATGQMITRRRIESWHSAQKGITARRLYDENGSLIAGDWRRADGVQTIYHHGARPQLRLAPHKRGTAQISFDDVWLLDPTATEFSSLIGSTQSAETQETDSTYVINYGGDTTGMSPGLVKASLVLGRAELHAVEQTLVVRQGDEVREYRFVEASFERRAPNSVAPAVFEPEPALMGNEGTGRRGDGAKISPSPALPVSPSLTVATPELELQVLKHLNQADAFYGEQISLTRKPEGRLRVQGIVETEKRKGELLQALATMKQNPAVQIQVETVAEAAERQARQRAVSDASPGIESIEVEAKSAVPAGPDLLAYLSRERELSGDALDVEVRRFADRAMVRTRQARRHALALKQIAERFSADDLRTLDVESRDQWRAMIAQHAKGVQQELEALRRELQPIFPMLTGQEGDAGFEITGDADLARAGKRLFELASAVDDAVGRSFSIYASGNAAAPVKTSLFSRSLRSAASLAQKIARGQ